MRILLADDHRLVRSCFRRFLEHEFEGAFVCEANNSTVALEQIRQSGWDLVLVEVSLPGGGWIDVLREARERQPRCPVLVLSFHAEDQHAVRAFRCGAAGYVSKDVAPEELVEAIRKVNAGAKYVSHAIAQKLAFSLMAEPSGPPHEVLSDREFQVFRMLAEGRTGKEIARELCLSEKTVATYRTRLLAKMNLRNTAELIRYAMEEHLLD